MDAQYRKSHYSMANALALSARCLGHPSVLDPVRSHILGFSHFTNPSGRFTVPHPTLPTADPKGWIIGLFTPQESHWGRFWDILTAYIFSSFFDALLDRFFIDFPSQLGSILASKIEPKSLNNRCQLRSKHRCIPRWGFEAILLDLYVFPRRESLFS